MTAPAPRDRGAGDRSSAPRTVSRSEDDEARLRVTAALRVVSEWPDDPDALDCGARLLYRARRLLLAVRHAA